MRPRLCGSGSTTRKGGGASTHREVDGVAHAQGMARVRVQRDGKNGRAAEEDGAAVEQRRRLRLDDERRSGHVEEARDAGQERARRRRQHRARGARQRPRGGAGELLEGLEH